MGRERAYAFCVPAVCQAWGRPPRAILRPCRVRVGLSVSVEGPGGEVGKLGVHPRGSLSLKPRFTLPPWGGGRPQGPEGLL